MGWWLETSPCVLLSSPGSFLTEDGVAKIDELLNYLKQNDCSDLHLAARLEPRVRLRGALEVIDTWSVLADQPLRQILQEITTVEQWNTFVAQGDLDYAYALPGVGRFRANYFLQRNGIGAVFRIIPEDVLTVEQLMLPQAVANLADLDQGLALITGPTAWASRPRWRPLSITSIAPTPSTS